MERREDTWEKSELEIPGFRDMLGHEGQGHLGPSPGFWLELLRAECMGWAKGGIDWLGAGVGLWEERWDFLVWSDQGYTQGKSRGSCPGGNLKSGFGP